MDVAFVKADLVFGDVLASVSEKSPQTCESLDVNLPGMKT